jgi:hypothetical protein
MRAKQGLLSRLPPWRPFSRRGAALEKGNGGHSLRIRPIIGRFSSPPARNYRRVTLHIYFSVSWKKMCGKKALLFLFFPLNGNKCCRCRVRLAFPECPFDTTRHPVLLATAQLNF